MSATTEAPTTALEEYRPVAAGLAELQKRYGSLVFDCRTAAGDRWAREARKELVTLRTTLEDKRKALKAPALERSRLIDAEAKRIEAAIRAVETPIDDQIRAVEQEKEAERDRRRQEEAEKIAAVRRSIVATFGPPSPRHDGQRHSAAYLRAFRITTEAQAVNAEKFGDLIIEAQEAKVRALAWLDAAIGDQAQREAEAAELARQRAEFAEQTRAETARRAEERKAEDARLHAEQAARAAEDLARRQEMARQQAQIDAQRAELERAAQEIAEAQRLRLAAQQAEARREAERLTALHAAAGGMFDLLRDWRALDLVSAPDIRPEIIALRNRRDRILSGLPVAAAKSSTTESA